jgi:hypothetical protein
MWRGDRAPPRGSIGITPVVENSRLSLRQPRSRGHAEGRYGTAAALSTPESKGCSFIPEDSMGGIPCAHPPTRCRRKSIVMMLSKPACWWPRWCRGRPRPPRRRQRRKRVAKALDQGAGWVHRCAELPIPTRTPGSSSRTQEPPLKKSRPALPNLPRPFDPCRARHARATLCASRNFANQHGLSYGFAPLRPHLMDYISSPPRSSKP